MPSIPAFLLRQAAIGFGVATIFAAAILVADPSGMSGLLLGAAEHPLPLLLLWAFLGMTFSAVQIGAAVMLSAEEAPQSGRRVPVLVPVPVRVTRRR
ncbi:hypothetical protein [Sabulicella rubraurantiaca]|uniref:hypothetical protein n=1 Tax=Sabulicella rubraurantiaca TaxID=2811429 RepID=UPI001A974387|nr:hypothetical protein [Sabulicella rubraurantiaca]